MIVLTLILWKEGVQLLISNPPFFTQAPVFWDSDTMQWHDFCVFDSGRSIFTFILKVKGFRGEQGGEKIYAQKYKIETQSSLELRTHNIRLRKLT